MECPDCGYRLTLTFSDATHFEGKCIKCKAEFDFILKKRQPKLVVKRTIDVNIIYERLMNDYNIKIQIPECDKGLAYFRIDGIKYSCHWEIDIGVDKNSIEVDIE